MTIRENIIRKLLLSVGITFATMIILAVAHVYYADENLPPVFLIGFIVMLGAIIYCNLYIRCPRCRGNLGITIIPALSSFSSKHKVKFCPFCGVSLDEKCQG